MQRTVARLEGRCAPCSSRAKAIPPQDFQIPNDLAIRVATLNEDLQNYRQMTWQFGVDFAHGFLDKEEERRRLYHEWFPRLRAFADQCRIDQPPPSDASLSKSERAKQRIYHEKISLDKPVSGREMHIAICSMSAVAIPIANRLWPLNNSHTVILTPEENDRWDEMYKHPKECFRWFAHYRWHIDALPERKIVLPDDRTICRWNQEDIPQHENPWVVSVGQNHGPLSGFGYAELWSWDGSEARFIKKAWEWVS